MSNLANTLHALIELFDRLAIPYAVMGGIAVRAYGVPGLVSPEDLVFLKLLAGRPRDLGDVTDVLFMQGHLDLQYMRRWAADFGVSDELEHRLAEASSAE